MNQLNCPINKRFKKAIVLVLTIKKEVQPELHPLFLLEKIFKIPKDLMKLACFYPDSLYLVPDKIVSCLS
jgi:hypothetical protein